LISGHEKENGSTVDKAKEGHEQKKREANEGR